MAQAKAIMRLWLAYSLFLIRSKAVLDSVRVRRARTRAGLVSSLDIFGLAGLVEERNELIPGQKVAVTSLFIVSDRSTAVWTLFV